MDNTANRIELCGELAALPEYSHENHGRRFCRFSLNVERLSGTVDTLQIIADEQTLSETVLTGGAMLYVDGQIRSFNNRDPDGRKLIISVFARQILNCDLAPENLAMLTGTICKEPTFRRTPLGREICDVMLAVNRQYRRTDYLPCILWGKTAQQVHSCPVGTLLQITGRLQSREYLKLLGESSEKRTAYEISVIEAEIVSSAPVDGE
jgi:single-stranded DNA-binding protein